MPQITEAKVQLWCRWGKNKKAKQGLHKQIPAQVLCELGPPAPFSCLGEPHWWQGGRAASVTPHLQWHPLLSPGTGHCTALQGTASNRNIHLCFPHGANALRAPHRQPGLGHLFWEAATRGEDPHILPQGSLIIHLLSLHFCWPNTTCWDSHLDTELVPQVKKLFWTTFQWVACVSHQVSAWFAFLLSLKQGELQLKPLTCPGPKFSIRLQTTEGALLQEWMFWMLGETGRGPKLAQCADMHFHLQTKPTASC